MPQPQLPSGDRDEIIAGLQEDVRERDREIARLNTELERALDGNRLAVAKLRQVLTPLYRGLQMIFGEMDSISTESASAGNAATDEGAAVSSKWEFWKKRFGGRIAETIDILLVQQQMNTSQLSHALRCDSRTLAKSVIYPMNKAGLIAKNGAGLYSLKQI